MTNRTITILSLASTTALVAMAGSALAETRQEAAIRMHRIDDSMPAIKGGLEISLAANTAQTLGDIGNNMDGDDVIGSAGELDLQIGYRVTPHLAIAFYATGQTLIEGTNNDRDVYTGSSGFEADFHLRPSHAVDPWISMGSGVRALVLDADRGTSVLVGAELARVQLGVDFRLDENFALGPVIGATATLYGAQKDAMQDDFKELDTKGITWGLSAGIAGRFNAFGSRL
jgi:hypothetical protein